MNETQGGYDVREHEMDATLIGLVGVILGATAGTLANVFHNPQ